MVTTIQTYPDMTDEPLHEFFGRDPKSYNIHLEDDGDEAEDGSGRPGIGIAAGAICFWVGQRSAATVGEAAATFNMPAEAVAQAVRWHPWMFLGGDDAATLVSRSIEQEGE